jgi:hypothetical protein
VPLLRPHWMACFFRNVLLARSQSKNTDLHEKRRIVFETDA